MERNRGGTTTSVMLRACRCEENLPLGTRRGVPTGGSTRRTAQPTPLESCGFAARTAALSCHQAVAELPLTFLLDSHQESVVVLGVVMDESRLLGPLPWSRPRSLGPSCCGPQPGVGHRSIAIRFVAGARPFAAGPSQPQATNLVNIPRDGIFCTHDTPTSHRRAPLCPRFLPCGRPSRAPPGWQDHARPDPGERLW